MPQCYQREPAAVKQDHLLPEGRQMPHSHQQDVLQLQKRITYSLTAGKCHTNIITKRSCKYEAGPLTY